MKLTDRIKQTKEDGILYHDLGCRSRGIYVKGESLTGLCNCVPKNFNQ